jgi:hypothetical protein
MTVRGGRLAVDALQRSAQRARGAGDRHLVGTPQRRDQAPHRGGRHLPQRGRHHPPGRCDPARAERRVGGAAGPLHDPGNHRTDAR